MFVTDAAPFSDADQRMKLEASRPYPDEVKSVPSVSEELP
jgi:hypothetical protein